MSGETVFAGIGKRYGAVIALADVSLVVGDGELLAVLGPSGCGKSTLLRITAGLEPATTGTITIGGRRIDGLPPHARDVAMVFQSYALYPHLTVRGNLEFPLRLRGVARAERRVRAEEMARLLEIDALLDRRPGALSGGQRQRVALGRALVRRPALFLLDEPLSNLDVRLRTSVRRFLRDLQRRVAVTTMLVTHDQTEAMTLGDRLAVLAAGRVQQVDTPAAVYARPANTFVAGFVGTPPMNLLPAEVDGGRLVVGGEPLAIPPALAAALSGRRRAVVGIRPEAFAADPAPATHALRLVPEPGGEEPLGGELLVRGRVGAAAATARLFGVGARVLDRIAAPADAMHLFDADDGRRLGP